MKKTKEQSIVKAVIEAGEDFEFYPTTPEILARVSNDMYATTYRWGHCNLNILDCGAGDGRVLMALAEACKYSTVQLFAIEKSAHLRSVLPPEIMIAGTDFHKESLIGKNADFIFSNPPYSEFEQWMVKIIEEGRKYAYLVVPRRWKESDKIKAAITYRNGCDVEVLMEADFMSSEGIARKARAQVDVLRVTFPYDEDDAFKRAFHRQFAANRPAQETPVEPATPEPDVAFIHPEDLVPYLVNKYMGQLEKITAAFHALSALDPEIIQAIGVGPSAICSALQGKLYGLKNDYWRKLFDQIPALRNRLTSASRNKLLQKIAECGTVDFEPNNIAAVILWAVKNINMRYDQQLVELCERLARHADLVAYKSNHSLLAKDNHGRNAEGDRFALANRMVLSGIGGFDEHGNKHLSDYAATFLLDILVVANSLGFASEGYEHLDRRCTRGENDPWQPGVSRLFHYRDAKGVRRELMSVKAFINGNLHINFNADFLRVINVEFGRLKGWLRSKEEAAEELGDPNAVACFGTLISQKLGSENLLLK